MSTDVNNSDLEMKVIGKIKEVFDPEIPVDVYELGLIYEVNILPINNVQVYLENNSEIL